MSNRTKSYNSTYTENKEKKKVKKFFRTLPQFMKEMAKLYWNDKKGYFLMVRNCQAMGFNGPFKHEIEHKKTQILRGTEPHLGYLDVINF